MESVQIHLNPDPLMESVEIHLNPDPLSAETIKKNLGAMFMNKINNM
jgi:hypothetical protein